MGVSSLPRGLIVDLITPLSRGGDIDGRSLERLLDRVLPYGQALLLAGPCGGEGRRLRADQREELLHKGLHLVKDRVPLLVWITEETPEKTAQTLLLLKKRMGKKSLRSRVFWVDTPLYYQSNRGLPRYYREFVETAEQPLVLHNDPGLIKELSRPFKRNNIRTAVLKQLSLLDRIQGLIFLGSLDRAHNYQKAVRARTEFRIFDGEESRFLTYPSLSGIVSIGANLAPRAWRRITDSSLNLGGDRTEYPDRLQQIWKTGQYLGELLEICRHNPVPLIKQILSDIGILETPACLVETGPPGKAPERIRELMESYGDFDEHSA
ncbi:MAG: dihydrodipicolinate synthase family protein [Deltaproteobacteria bacterium]|nr:dihydrodipicolinate synthase family protein [Deltaproteobacteria bacterium]